MTSTRRSPLSQGVGHEPPGPHQHPYPIRQGYRYQQVPDTATPEFFALSYMAHMAHDKRIPREVKREIAEVLVPCFVPVVGDPER